MEYIGTHIGSALTQTFANIGQAATMAYPRPYGNAGSLVDSPAAASTGAVSIVQFWG